MPIRQLCWRVPITHATGGSSDANVVVVDYVRIQVTLIGSRSVWVHILNDDAFASAVGAAVCALPTNVPPYVSQTLLIDEAQEAEIRDVSDGGGTTTVGMSASPHGAFSSSLARKLVTKFAPRSATAAPRAEVLFTVCCGIHGPLEASLLGTSVGGPCASVLEFGAVVFKSVSAMVTEVLGGAADSAAGTPG